MTGGGRAGGRHRGVEALLSEAEVLGAQYDGGDVAAIRERVLADPCPPSAPGGPPARAPQYPSDGEQAAHDLDLAVSLVVGSPQAAAGLARLADADDAEGEATGGAGGTGEGGCPTPEGALVFACLLHLAGYREAAPFWWRFAAGGGNRTAAFCLCLDHRRRGEFRDADYWRGQYARLGEEAGGPAREAPKGTAADGTTRGTAGGGGGGAAEQPARTARPLLPEGVRHALLSQCHEGGRPRLPAALEAVIHRLPVAEGDEDFAGIPRPARGLPGRLAGARAPAARTPACSSDDSPGPAPG